MDLIRQPILLDDDFNEIRRLFPSSLSVTLNSEPLSLANMTLPKDEEPLSTRQWVEVFGENGSFGYFRVANDQTMYGQAQNVSLEHCLCTLRDNSTAPIIKATTEPGQKPPQEEQDAAKVKWTGTMRELLQHAIDCQETIMWQLGEVPEIDGLEYEPKNANVLAVIMRILQLRNGLYLDTDLSTTPWTLNVREAEIEPSCECRLTRNMESVEVEMNTNALYTRVVCPRLADGVIEDEEAMRKYGSITYFNNLSANVTRAEALEACKDFLNKLISVVYLSHGCNSIGAMMRTNQQGLGFIIGNAPDSVFSLHLLHIFIELGTKRCIFYIVDGSVKALVSIHCHSAASGSQMRMIIDSEKQIKHTILL